MAIEIEKKYRLTPERYSEIIGELNELGAEFTGEDSEENTIFSNEEMHARNAIVRIRRTQEKTILTFKQRLPGISDAKEQVEFETEISNAEAARSIVESIGLKPWIVYEK